MKSLKKILSIFAAFMMVVGLTMTNASAEGETGSIIINDAKQDQYTAYKILNATIAQIGTHENPEVSTVYVANADQYALLTTIVEGIDNPFDFQKNTADTYNASLKTGKGASDVVKYVKALVESKDSSIQIKVAKITSVKLITTWVGEGDNRVGTAKDTDVELGYYFITSGPGSVGMLDTAGAVLEIDDKNDIGFKKTVAGSQLVTDKKVGDLIDFTIEFNAYAGWTNVVVSDSLTEGLAIVKDNSGKPAVTITSTGTKGVPINTVSEVTTADNKDSFTITFPVIDENQKITIKYQARVTEHAIFEINSNDKTQNSASLVGDNLPTNLHSTVEVKVFDFDLVKTNSSNEIISGAQFELYESKKDGNDIVVDTTKKVQFVKSGNNYNVASAAQIEDSNVEKVTTIEAGNVRIQGLGSNVYFLQEIKAPDGYNALKEVVKVDMTKAADKNAVVTGTTYENGGVEVENLTGTELPSTGGMGTTMIYIAGAILMVGAAIIFVTNKRMKHE